MRTNATHDLDVHLIAMGDASTLESIANALFGEVPGQVSTCRRDPRLRSQFVTSSP